MCGQILGGGRAACERIRVVGRTGRHGGRIARQTGRMARESSVVSAREDAVGQHENGGRYV